MTGDIVRSRVVVTITRARPGDASGLGSKVVGLEVGPESKAGGGRSGLGKERLEGMEQRLNYLGLSFVATVSGVIVALRVCVVVAQDCLWP